MSLSDHDPTSGAPGSAETARSIGDVVAASRLLDRELPDRRFVDDRYLRWLYGENPSGRAFVAEAVEDSTMVGHYALVPQRYRDAAGEEPFVFSLNAVTRSGGQRRGTFSRLGRQVWDEAREAGVRAVVGVTNDRSITPVVRQGWRHLFRLPVLVCPPASIARSWESTAADDDFLAGPATQWFADVDGQRAQGWTNCWDQASLSWRLAMPGMGPYGLHRDEATLAVSTCTVVNGIRVAVIMKLLVRGDCHQPQGAQSAVSAACRFHGAPAAVYAGFNRHRRLRGWPLPDRFRQAPLNLMVFSLDPRVPQDTFELGTFEFLDMDGF